MTKKKLAWEAYLAAIKPALESYEAAKKTAWEAYAVATKPAQAAYQAARKPTKVK